jgi:hypothetical protein
MVTKKIIFCAAMALSAVSVFPVGQTAVITLTFPHGAENCGMGEAGVSLAENLNSVFWNPAALPAIGRNLSLQYAYSHFSERLLPVLDIDDLEHTNEIHAIFINGFVRNFDFGASYSVNSINFGVNPWEEEETGIIEYPNSSETVRSFAVGAQYAGILSLGVALKDVESRLAPGYGNDPRNGIARAQVFDAGVRLEKKFTIANAFDVHPALGFSVQSFPREQVRYIYDDTVPQYDPLPLMRWYGASIKLNALDFLGVVFAKERDYAVIDQEFNEHQGWKIQVTPFFALLLGSMEDSIGDRFERNRGYIFTFNYQRTLDAFIRVTDFFGSGLAEKLRRQKQLAEKHHLKPNFHVQYARSVIHTLGDNDLRDGQTRKELSFGVSLIGDLGAFDFKKKGNTPPKKPDAAVKPDTPIMQEDSELVQ